MAVRDISQRSRGHIQTDALLFRFGPQTDHQLGSRCTKEIPRQTNTRNKAGHQSSLSQMPSKCRNSRTNLHTTARSSSGSDDASIIVRWRSLINFRRMTIALMDNKFIAYSKAITDMLERSWTNHNELETNVGRWVHMAQIIPFVHHFLSRIRFLMKRAKYR